MAAPSTNPNYIFTWTRDSALVFKAIVDSYVLNYTLVKSIPDLLPICLDLPEERILPSERASINTWQLRKFSSKSRTLVAQFRQVVSVNPSLTSTFPRLLEHGAGTKNSLFRFTLLIRMLFVFAQQTSAWYVTIACDPDRTFTILFQMAPHCVRLH